MISTTLSFELPLPWGGKTFSADQIGAINFLVGPNGSGKSRFAAQLASQLDNSRLLGTDRLSGMEQIRPFKAFQVDPFDQGYARNRFPYLKQAGTEGSGIDTILLLEERIDLRIQVEATLGHLFNREIILEWDSGNLIANVRRLGDNSSYRLDREECHGIKELLVLLTHLYDDQRQYLIIDEPELNLHPQYQSFFMQEVRRMVGDSTTDGNKKIVFLITHSPFILDLRTEDDLSSVISFDLMYSVPRQVSSLTLGISSPSSFTRRLNAHHKQLFFSDNPIFVEGIHDAWLVEAMVETRGVSVSGAGSCIIDAGGAEDVNQYVKLCQGLGKSAHFLYDLDSLFSGNLRACIKDDESVQSFLASAGLGNDLGTYCGQLERALTCLITKLIDAHLPENLLPLGSFLSALGEKSEWKPKQWKRARTAVMTAISRYKEDIASVVSLATVEDVEGRRAMIVSALKEKNIHLLPGGTLERYLPHYRGDEYELTSDAKRQAIFAEIEELTELSTEEELAERYGELYTAVCSLPSKEEVDLDAALVNHLSSYIHEFQRTVVNNPDWQTDQIEQRLLSIQSSWEGVFSIQDYRRTPAGGFGATISIMAMLGQGARVVHVNDSTNAGMGSFRIDAATISEAAL